MLNTYIGPDRLPVFWQAVAVQKGRIVSIGAATLVLRCSFERLYRLIEEGDVEAWAYRPSADAPPTHYMVSIPSLVRHGIREGRFHSAQDRDLGGLNVSDGEFARMKAEAVRNQVVRDDHR